MRLVIFGSTGATGRRLVELALAQGHSVTAFARTPAKLEMQHANLKIVQGDVMDLSTIEPAMAEQEVVFSTLGAPASQKDRLRSDGTQNIIRAMQTAGVKRLICMTTLGMGNSRALLPFSYKCIIVPLLLRQAFADSERQENFIRQSQLEWTIVRPAALTNGPHIGSYRHGFTAPEKNLKFKISRADVADFMLKQATSETYLHQTPALSY